MGHRHDPGDELLNRVALTAILAVALLVTLPMTASAQIEFTTYEDASGNDNDLTEVGDLTEGAGDPAQGFGTGIEGFEGSATPANRDYAERNGTAMGSPEAFAVSFAFVRGAVGLGGSNYVLHLGNTSGPNPNEANAIIVITKSGQGKLQFQWYRFGGSVATCLHGTSMPGGFHTAWVKRIRPSPTAQFQAYIRLDNEPIKACKNLGTLPPADAEHTLRIGCSLTCGATHGWQDGLLYEMRIWHRDVPNATLNASVSGDSGFALEGTEIAAYFFENGTTTPPGGTTDDPTEFTTGLGAFLNSLGFKTPASQLFFLLMLIGGTLVAVAIATKDMTPGRLKTLVVGGTSMGVGVFGALAGLIQVWALFITLVLGAIGMTGWSQQNNTTLEFLRARRAPTPGDPQQDLAPTIDVTATDFDEAPDAE